ncbi:MAG TPA: CPBP family intramembrane glutamic endopeptidase [Chloroflexota bacterium]|nr:CPBP family intramembrane glutamic endopeptidase [Chloroflexota bacterium]
MTAAAVRPPLLLAGLAGATLIRVGLGAQQLSGVLPFIAILLALVATAGMRRPDLRLRPIGMGLAGAAVLIAFPVLHGGPLLVHPESTFPLWMTLITAGSLAEEMFFRGALFSAVESHAGTLAAVTVSSVAFALLHVPLYGWGAVPLDLAVGVWLGGLRAVSGSVTAPAIAHVMADIATWWVP